MSAVYKLAALRGAICLAEKVLPTKPATHLLRCIRIGAEGITAVGDVEAAEVAIAPLKGSVDVLVSAADLISRLDKAKSDDVSLEVKDKDLIIKAKGSKWTIPTVPLVDALKPPKAEAPRFEDVDAAVFRRALEATLPAAGTDAAAPQYYGVELLPDGRVVSTDGRRVHVFTGGPRVGGGATVLTPKFAKLLVGLKDETFRIALGKDLVVAIDGATFYHRQLGTQFVAADKLVDLTWKHLSDAKLATVVADDFVAAVEAASLAAEHSQVTLQIVDGVLVVTGRQSADVSRCEVSGDVEAVASSAPFLVDAVKATGAKSVELRTSSNIQVGIVVCAAGAKPHGECAMIAQTIR